MRKLSPALLMLFFAFFVQLAQAQSEEKALPRFSKSIKLHYTLNNNLLLDGRSGMSNRLSIFDGLSPALQLTSAKGNFHEFSIPALYLSSSPSEDFFLATGSNDLHLKNIMGSFRYEYGHRLFKNKELGNFNFYAGFALTSYYGYSKLFFAAPGGQLQRHNTIGMNLDFVPRVSYDISDRLSLELSMPINMVHTSFTRSKVLTQGPDNVTEIYGTSGLRTSALQPQFRLSLIYRLHGKKKKR